MGSIMDQERPWKREGYDARKEANSNPMDWADYLLNRGKRTKSERDINWAEFFAKVDRKRGDAD